MDSVAHRHIRRGGSGAKKVHESPEGADPTPVRDGKPSKASRYNSLIETLDQRVNPYSSYTVYDDEIRINVISCVGAAVADPLMSLMDTYFVARALGTRALAAVGANTPVFNAVFHVGTFACSHAVTNHVAHALARGDKARAGRDIISSLILTLLLSVCVASLLCLRSHNVLGAMGVDGALYNQGEVYMVTRGAAIPATLIMLVAQGVFRAILDMKTPLMVVVAAGTLNLLLDPLFIITFEWGVRGAAIATATAQASGAIVFLVLLWNRRDELGIQAALHAGGSRLRPYELLEFARNMLVLGFRSANIIVVWALAGMVVAWQGVAATAGHQLVLQVAMLLLNVTYAFMTVGQSMVAARGKPYSNHINLAKRIIVLATITGISLALVTSLSWTYVMTSISKDPRVHRVVGPCLIPVAGMLFFSHNNALEGLLVGTGDVQYIIGMYIPSTMVFLGCLYASWATEAGLVGVWSSLSVYYVVLWLFLGGRAVVPAFRGPFFAGQVPAVADSGPTAADSGGGADSGPRELLTKTKQRSRDPSRSPISRDGIMTSAGTTSLGPVEIIV